MRVSAGTKNCASDEWSLWICRKALIPVLYHRLVNSRVCMALLSPSWRVCKAQISLVRVLVLDSDSGVSVELGLYQQEHRVSVLLRMT
jgi:hypothetical protein